MRKVDTTWAVLFKYLH